MRIMRTLKKFKIKHLGEYHNLYVQSDTLLLGDVLENVRNKCLEIYELDPIYFVSAPGLAWQACLKKTGVISLASLCKKNMSKFRTNNRL